jgi:50S ribosomal subunit-associated GTPase HflX
LAANKSDLFDEEKVPEDEAQNYAKEIGAIFKLTSAFTGTGIDLLFKSIGNKFLGPNKEEEENEKTKKDKVEYENNEEENENGEDNNNQKEPFSQPIKLDINKEKNKNKNKGKKCC